MGTPNFARGNASKIFAVMTGYKNEDTGEYEYPEDWEWDDNLEYLRSEVKELPYEFYLRDEHDNGRCYGRHTFAQIVASKPYGDMEVSVFVDCVRQSAYYEGATLDWEVSYRVDPGGDYDAPFEEAELAVLFDYESDTMNWGMSQIQARNAVQWMESIQDEMIEAVETIYAKASGHVLKCVAVASNGEAFYENA